MDTSREIELRNVALDALAVAKDSLRSHCDPYLALADIEFACLAHDEWERERKSVLMRRAMAEALSENRI